jgi:hypothetical protein
MAEINVQGTWTVANDDGTLVDFYINQNQKNLNGTYIVQGSSTGTLVGFIDGIQIRITAQVNNVDTLEYSGTFNDIGRLTGILYNLYTHKSTTWCSVSTFL